MNDTATSNEALAIVLIAPPGIWVAKTCWTETALGFVVVASMAQAVVIAVFAVLFAGVALCVGTIDFVALAVILDGGALRGAVTPLIRSGWEIFVANCCASGKQKREK